MRIVCLQHVPFEGPGAMGAWARARGHSLALTRLFAGEPVPSLQSFDALLILGGPMSVNTSAQFDWLEPEKAFIRDAIDQDKHVLGICLGAQLIANVLGAKVVPGAEREVGWFPVKRTTEGGKDRAFGLMPEEFVPLHWHGETYELPAGATCLAFSEAYPQQAFAFGARVLGVQFHLESTPESAEALTRNCPGDLVPGRFVQDPNAIVGAYAFFEDSNRLMTILLDRFISRQDPLN